MAAAVAVPMEMQAAHEVRGMKTFVGTATHCCASSLRSAVLPPHATRSGASSRFELPAKTALK